MYDITQSPEFLRSRPFQITVLRVRAVFLIVFMLAGVLVLVGSILHYLSIVKNPTDPPLAVVGKISMVAFVVGWNILVVWMFRQNMRALAQMKRDEIAEHQSGR